MKLSIVIPTYNNLEYLKFTIDPLSRILNMNMKSSYI